MFRLLHQPYPSGGATGQLIRMSAFMGLFVGLFLLTFQPFGLNLWETPHKPLKLLGFGLITFVITAFSFIGWRQLFPEQFADERWTVGRQILLVMVNILLIAIGNRLYLEWLLNIEGYANVTSWGGMILITFLIGLFPTTGAVLFNYIRQLKKYRQGAAELPVQQPPPVVIAEPAAGESASVADLNAASGALLTLIADNEKDSLSISPANLLFIESSDNYCTVVYFQNGQPIKPLLRSSLSRLESQINAPHIVRCHRSYVVNLDRVERVTGNAQGYKLHLLGGQFQVPVARKYNDTLVAELRAL